MLSLYIVPINKVLVFWIFFLVVLWSLREEKSQKQITFTLLHPNLLQCSALLRVELFVITLSFSLKLSWASCTRLYTFMLIWENAVFSFYGHPGFVQWLWHSPSRPSPCTRWNPPLLFLSGMCPWWVIYLMEQNVFRTCPCWSCQEFLPLKGWVIFRCVYIW